MATIDTRGLVAARFKGDIELFAAIQKDPALLEEQKRLDVLRRQSRLRMRLLANAIRVSAQTLPAVATTVSALASRVDLGKPLEVFVYASGEINAHVTETNSRFLVGLSSEIVKTLSPAELEYVIGHELAHAFYNHTAVAASHLVEIPRLAEHSKLLRAWERSAEISADRVGLLCCGDLEVATTALVKTLAGLPMPGVRFKPSDIANQWDALLQELMDDGGDDAWENSHPFPPLRIKALEAFWSGRGASSGSGDDAETFRLLSLMDSGTRPREAGSPIGADAMLSQFVLWGGLYLGLADGSLPAEARARLMGLTVPGVDLDQVLRGGDPSAVALEQFRAAKKNRRAKLSARELTSIMRQLIAFAALDQRVTPAERSRLGGLARELELVEQAVELLLKQHSTSGA